MKTRSLKALSLPVADDIRERFEKHYVAEPNTGCWLWTGAYGNGYGAFTIWPKVHRAHRVAYQMYKGAIPDGLHLDHLCCTKTCVNPDHLEAVTSGENTRRGGNGKKAAILRMAQTHCKRGHPFSGSNLRTMPSGARLCRQCNIERKRRWREINEPRVGKDLSGLALGGVANGARQRAKTHCPQGHEYTPENTSIYRTWRRCKTCHAQRQSVRNKMLSRKQHTTESIKA